VRHPKCPKAVGHPLAGLKVGTVTGRFVWPAEIEDGIQFTPGNQLFFVGPDPADPGDAPAQFPIKGREPELLVVPQVLLAGGGTEKGQIARVPGAERRPEGSGKEEIPPLFPCKRHRVSQFYADFAFRILPGSHDTFTSPTVPPAGSYRWTAHDWQGSKE